MSRRELVRKLCDDFGLDIETAFDVIENLSGASERDIVISLVNDYGADLDQAFDFAEELTGGN